MPEWWNCYQLESMSLLINRIEPAKFPLNRLPAELVHMICTYLTPTQVASIRFISRTIAAIALEYITTSVTLRLKENSFDRLLEIAHHPVTSKYVHSLHYEHDFLTVFDRTEWESNISTREMVTALDGSSEIGASAFPASNRAWRAFFRDFRALKAYNMYGKIRMDQAFSTYQRHCAEQDRAWQSDFFSNKLTEALQNLPNLRTIYMPTRRSYSRYRTEIAKSLNGALYDQATVQSEGAAATRSILLAVDQAVRARQNWNARAAKLGHGAALSTSSWNSSNTSGDDSVKINQVSTNPSGGLLKGDCSRRNDLGGSNHRALRIRNFSSESFDWKILLEDEETFTAMKRSISYLTTFGICLRSGCFIKDTGSYNSLYRFLDDNEASRQCLRRGRLYEFIKSAPLLEELNVSLDLNNRRPTIYLSEVVGSFQWTCLKTVHFQRIKISVSSLEEFCSRHSSTLSVLSLGDLLLDAPLTRSRGGNKEAWYLVFSKIREATKLYEADVYGLLGQSLEYWDMCDHADVRCASGTLIGRYLVGDGGNSSLEDFLVEERGRILEQDRTSPVSDIDYESSLSESTSESEGSSSESDA